MGMGRLGTTEAIRQIIKRMVRDGATPQDIVNEFRHVRPEALHAAGRAAAMELGLVPVEERTAVDEARLRAEVAAQAAREIQQEAAAEKRAAMLEAEKAKLRGDTPKRRTKSGGVSAVAPRPTAAGASSEPIGASHD